MQQRENKTTEAGDGRVKGHEYRGLVKEGRGSLPVFPTATTRSTVTSIFLYACESWTLTAELERKIRTMEMRCYCKILHISYKDHVTNKEVHAKIQQAIGPHEDFLTIVKRRKTAVVRTCLPFIRSGRNHLARHSEKGKKTRQTEEEVGRQHQGMDRSGVRHVPEGSGEQGKMEETGCEIIYGAPTILAVKGQVKLK